MSEVIYLLPFLIALALFILICASSEPGPHDRAVAFPRASADHLARAMRTRSVLVLAVICALAAYNTVNADMIAMMKFSSPVYVMVAVVAIARWIEARRALRMLAHEDVTTSVVADIVICESRGTRVLMHANRWLVARARRQALPRASL